MEKLFAKHRPPKHDLQSAYFCFNPLDDAETPKGKRTKPITAATKWLQRYFQPLIVHRFVVDDIPYFEYLGSLLDSLDLFAWQEYLTFIWLNHVSSFFTDTYSLYDELENDEKGRPFPYRKLMESQEAWWQDCGLQYVNAEKETLQKGRQLTMKIAEELRIALSKIFFLSKWQEKTKTEALLKLKNMVFNIGWSDIPFARVMHLEQKTYFDELILLGWQYQYQIFLSKHNQPTNRQEWRFIGFHTVNACYSREVNVVYIPASLFHFPFLDLDESKSHENFGGLGSVIGHEIYHAFDFDSQCVNGSSQLSEWWEPPDALAFKQDTKKIIKLYETKNPISKVTWIDSKQREHEKYVPINGRLTLSENIADYVSLHLTWEAFLRWHEEHQTTPDAHRFFEFFALSQAQIYSEHALERALKTDVHAVAVARVNLPLSCFEPFLQLYQITPKDPMFTPIKNRPGFFQSD